MLKIENLCKNFDNTPILENIDITFETGKIYGLLGTNGAGKSTLLRTISGIYKPTSGSVKLDSNDVYENELCKSEIFYIPDENIFLPRKNINKCLDFYKVFYSNFNEKVFNELQDIFNLDLSKDIKSFSKGMKKQAMLLMVLSFTPKYIILDETFDGLDPIVRLKVKKYLISLAFDENICLIVSTHSITDIENLADEIIFLDKKSVTYHIKQNNDEYDDTHYKVQVCFETDIDDLNSSLNILHHSKIGSVNTFILNNSKSDITEIIGKYNPIIFDINSLSVEETFMYIIDKDRQKDKEDINE